MSWSPTRRMNIGFEQSRCPGRAALGYPVSAANPFKSDPAYVAHAANLRYAYADAAKDWEAASRQKAGGMGRPAGTAGSSAST